MNLSEQTLIESTGLNPAPKPLLPAPGRTHAQSERTIAFSDIVEFGMDRETDLASKLDKIGRIQSVSASDVAPAGAYEARPEFLEFSQYVESVASENVATPLEALATGPRKSSSQELHLEAAVPPESEPAIVAADVDVNVDVDRVSDSPPLPKPMEGDFSSIPNSESNDESVLMGAFDPQQGLASQKTREAELTDGPEANIRALDGTRGPAPAVESPQVIRAPKVWGQSQPLEASELHNTGNNTITSDSLLGNETMTKRHADIPLREPKVLTTSAVQVAAPSSFVNQTHRELVEHEPGLLGEHDEKFEIQHRDNPGLVGIAQSDARTSTQIPLGLQVKNMQNVRDALANLRPDGSVEIALDPPELGRIRLAMSGHEHQMSVVITVDRPEVLDVIRRQIDLLKTELTAQGFTQFDFDFQRNDRESTGPMTVDAKFSGTDETDMPMNGPEQNIRLPNGRMDIRI